MTAPQAQEAAPEAASPDSKALAKLDPRVAEAKALREITVAIRGTQWGKECTPQVQAAVARYCLKNGLDAVRHVEVLGGRLYLTAEFYEERGTPLVLAGIVQVSEPEFVHADKRLDDLAKHPDATTAAWAENLRIKRMMARIELGIPEDATGACIYRGTVKTPNGVTTLVGFNWCGGESKVKKMKSGDKFRSDPVGDAEPTKTAQSRAKRRMWRQIVVAIPEAQDRFGHIEAAVRIANAELGEVISAETKQIEAERMKPIALNPGDGLYGEPEPVIRKVNTAPATEYSNPHPYAEEPAARTAEDERFEMDLDN